MIDDLDLGFDEPERGRRVGTGAAPQAQERVAAAAAGARHSWPC